MRAQLKDKLLYGTLYTGFFVVAFLISAYLTFPYDRVKDLLVSKVAGDAQSADALVLQVGDLKPSWFTGIALSDVDLTRPAEADGQPVTLHFDTVKVRAKVFPLLIGKLSLGISAEVGDGSLHATYAKGDVSEVDAELDELDVKQLGLGAWIGVPLKGSASGKINLALDDDGAKSTGDVDLQIHGLHIADGKTKIKIPGMNDGVTLDELNAGTLNLVLKVSDGVASLDKLTTSGPELKVNGSGGVRVSNPLRRSRVDLQLDLQFSDGYRQKNDHTKALFEIMRIPDGSMHLRVAGTVQTLRVTPGTASAVGGGLRTAGTRTGPFRRRSRAAGGSAPGLLGAAAPAADDEAAPAAPAAPAAEPSEP